MVSSVRLEKIPDIGIETGPGPYKLILGSGQKGVVPQPRPERDIFYTQFNVIEKIGEG